jgi:hypothetical protein
VRVILVNVVAQLKRLKQRMLFLASNNESKSDLLKMHLHVRFCVAFWSQADCDTFSVAPSVITANLKNVLAILPNHLALRFVVNKLCLISKNAFKFILN